MALARVADVLERAWIPSPWGDEIAAEIALAAERAGDPVPARGVERALRDAWGTRPTEELDELDLDPVAVTPSAQVHRGVLDGAPVAVKVLRPGLAASVRQDLALLDGLLAPLGAAFPALDPRALLREVRERVLEELDLEHEASVQRRFHRALRNHPFLTVPAPVTRLAHEGVLVAEWVDGTPILRAPDPDDAAAKLVAFTLGSARWGTVHADPVPEDVLVLPDGGLAILDFGATRQVEPAWVDNVLALVEAFAAEDAAALGEALAALGVLPASDGPAVLELARHALGELGGAEPSRLDTDAVVRARDRLLDRLEELLPLVVKGAAPPADAWPARGIAQLFGTIARVGATGAWRELMRAALRDGWG